MICASSFAGPLSAIFVALDATGVIPGLLYPGTSSSANDSAGFPRRKIGRFASFAPLSEAGTFALSSGLFTPAFDVPAVGAPEEFGAGGLAPV